MSETHPLREFRARQVPPMSRAELAALLGVRAPTIWRWEMGARTIRDSFVPRIVEKTGIPAAELRPDLVKLLEPERAAS